MSLRVRGRRPLEGSVTVGGSKNASLPILAASLLTQDPVHIRNLPAITDVQTMLEILAELGCTVKPDGELRAGDIEHDVPQDLARKMRASIVLLGPLLARVGSIRLPRPGGDDIGMRRVEQHVNGLRRLGAIINETSTEFIGFAPRRLRGARIVLDMPTVTGTENLMMAAALAEGRTEIWNAAREPHVQDLAAFLNKMGARISGAGSHEVVIEGVEELHGAEHSVCADYLEAGTYALAVAAAGGAIEILGAPTEDLTGLLIKLMECDVEVDVRAPDRLVVSRDSQRCPRSVDMMTWVHPGFPTDLQSQWTAFVTQASGDAMITDPIFESRFQHVGELQKMGADIDQINSRMALVHGPSALTGAEVTVPDIRSGAALVIAGLCAEGETLIRESWHVDRGYPDLAGHLRGLGADIEEVAEPAPATP